MTLLLFSIISINKLSIKEIAWYMCMVCVRYSLGIPTPVHVRISAERKKAFVNIYAGLF